MSIVRRFFCSLLVVTTSLPCAADQSAYHISLDQYGGMHALRSTATRYPRLVAEFEPTRALLLSVADWHSQHRHILIEIAEKTAHYVYLLVLCKDTRQIREVTEWLLESDQDISHVYFCQMPVNTIWIRDFGPIFAETSSGTGIFDFLYEGSRPHDDALPVRWARSIGATANQVRWTMQGGNLATNGQGLALMTTRIFKDNYIRFPNPSPTINVEHERRIIVIKAMMQGCNLSELVVLEPLDQEITGHVDMFASFISPTHVVVAEVSAQQDPINAQILNRNVSRLQKIKIDGRPLQVSRIPIPGRRGTSWSASTNAIMVDQLILLPTFSDDPLAIIAAARTAYSRLVPGSVVETIDMTTMRDLQGQLHCLSLHVPRFADLPEPVYSFQAAKQTYFPER